MTDEKGGVTHHSPSTFVGASLRRKKAELEQPDNKKVIDAFVGRGNRGRFVMADGVKEV
jgi:hypothetical protein